MLLAKNSLKPLAAALFMLGLAPSAAFAVDCGAVTVSVEQLDAQTWRATAFNETGEVCGTAEAPDEETARAEAKKNCGCE